MGGFLISTVVQVIPIAVVVLSVWLFVRYERNKRKYSPFTEKLLRSPGHSLSLELDKLLEDFYLPILLASISGVVVVTKWNEMTTNVGRSILLVFMVGITIYAIYRLRTIHIRAWSVRLGCEGEVYTGQELNFLMRDGAWVYHDIPYKYGNIDHIVISTGGVFAVETKAVRKPQSRKGRADYTVLVSGGKLNFPHVVTSKPMAQAQCHANYLSEFIQSQIGIEHKVTPVVAIPGWFIKRDSASTDVLVINPKRGKALSNLVKRQKLSGRNTELIAGRLESYARDVYANSDFADPDATKKFDFWNNRKPEDQKL